MTRTFLFAAIGLCLPVVAQAASYTIVDIGTNASGDSSGFGINESGQVAGRDARQQYGRAFIYDGTVHDLGTLGRTP